MTDYTEAPNFMDSLFKRSAPAQSHSETSREAAREIEPSAGTLRALVLAYLRGTGERGATDEEIQDALAMNPSTERPRRIELLRDSFIYESDDKRKTKSGRNATVWKAMEF